MSKLILANISNIKDIMEIINDAKQYLKSQGSTQWNLPDGYPNESTLLKDIENKECYIYLENNLIIGVMVIMETEDENYDEIDGIWLNNDKYVSIHRIAIRNGFHNKQIGYKMLKLAETIIMNKGLYSIKIDTHKINIPMINTLSKLNYTYCGVITLKRSKEDNLRNAYQKLLK
jgi:ribosomal protein S18 acetylase RimI-like enzyme